jgi:hypothetical protein
VAGSLVTVGDTVEWSLHRHVRRYRSGASAV